MAAPPEQTIDTLWERITDLEHAMGEAHEREQMLRNRVIYLEKTIDSLLRSLGTYFEEVRATIKDTSPIERLNDGDPKQGDEALADGV